jgi:UDP-N-acetylmuramyl pentapeptide phosphotransferase/UDP-N-acetylglucosamine-1-phosphate transferase
MRDTAEKKGIGHYGGVAFVISFLVALFFVPVTNEFKVITLNLLLFSAIGFIDDLSKSFKFSSDGLTSLGKLALQLISGLIVSYTAMKYSFISNKWYVIVFYTVYLAYFVNAVNITDGLDGLATLVSIPIVALLYLIIHDFSLLTFLFILLAFLYFNAGEAKIFMGDTGSHAIGAVIGAGALVSGHPVMIAMAAAVPAFELLSSLLQIISIRCFHKKLFLIAPYHHCLEKRGWRENLITSCFSSISLLLSITVFL